MSKIKKALCLVLTLIMVMSLGAIGFTANAESNEAYLKNPSDFTWDNATVYFLLTDRFANGDESNDHSYNRGLDQNGNVADYNTVAAFQGGDFKGLTEKINEGYFNDLGVNAIWVSGWYEQQHGYSVGGDGKNSFPHYAYHGYYALDFTEIDKNYGTEEEFKAMVDAAHAKGLRVVMDVVMNHPSYNNIYDMNEYGYGVLKEGWEEVYYNFSKINQTNYHGKIDYNTGADKWLNWWGKDWMRAGIAGYDNNGTNDLTNSVTYLPDFKTEGTKAVELPQILVTKWTKEGTLEEKVAELDATFEKYDLGEKTVTNHLVAWYAQWVEKYGIDGFRCDTAKHVDKASWAALDKACSQALANWREENPDAIGADWDEDFWMTGEHFGQNLTENDYYTSGFDSMINFAFSPSATGGADNGMLKARDINATYQKYADTINTNENFNALTYVSSHDTGLCRKDLAYQASALLLLPGGVQIFYGDETNRGYVECSIHDHENRSFMNWADVDSNTNESADYLAHWQTIGKFRNSHVAVGAGSHKALEATNGVAFARTYDKNDVYDKVVCVIDADKNTDVTITMSGAFMNGTELENKYTGEKVTVEGGKVTLNSGDYGTILLEQVGGAVKPDTGDYEMGDVNMDGKLNIRDATYIQKYLAKIESMDDIQLLLADFDGNGKANVKDATAIQKYIAGII
ncbi:MAG: alpha-amylase [Clostridia bacterium]|nr:alpha-amylase [Clostridia bacterium]